MKTGILKTDYPKKMMIPNYTCIIYISLLVSLFLTFGVISLISVIKIAINSDTRLLLGLSILVLIFIVSFYYTKKIFKRRITWIFNNGKLSSPSLPKDISIDDINEIIIGCRKSNTKEADFQQNMVKSMSDSRFNVYDEVLFIILQNEKVLVLYLNDLKNGYLIMENIINTWSSKINLYKSPMNRTIYIQSYINKLSNVDILQSSLKNHQQEQKIEKRLSTSLKTFKVIYIAQIIMGCVLLLFSLLCLLELTSRYIFKKHLILGSFELMELIQFPLTFVILFLIYGISKLLRRNKADKT